MKDSEILERLLFICEAEKVEYTKEGLEALLFCADGDLRVGVNSLQATVSGFGVVNGENVMKVCDQPPPLTARQIVTNCREKKMREARSGIDSLWRAGASVELA